MSENDDHVQEIWVLARDGAEDITIELWTDDETVRVHGGPDDGDDSDRGRRAVEETLLPKYLAAGYRLERTYQVNDPVTRDDELEDEGDPHARPERCPDCGGPVEYDPHFSHPDISREGPAWICTACKWGEFLVA
jgi:hypothetical protein